MDEREQRILGDVLFERLLDGEDPEALKVHLGSRFARVEAEALVAAALARLKAAEAEPHFDAAAAAVRKRRNPKATFWRGPIPSREEAERIARIPAYWFGGAGGLLLIIGLSRGRLDLSALLSALLFIVPSAALWKSRSPIAAGVLAVLGGVAALSTAVAAVSLLTMSGIAGAGLGIVAALWLTLSAAAARAFTATRYLRRAPERDLAVFD